MDFSILACGTKEWRSQIRFSTQQWALSSCNLSWSGWLYLSSETDHAVPQLTVVHKTAMNILGSTFVWWLIYDIYGLYMYITYIL